MFQEYPGNFHALTGTPTAVEAVELPGDGRTMPVDKRAVIRSDRYLNSVNQTKYKDNAASAGPI